MTLSGCRCGDVRSPGRSRYSRTRTRSFSNTTLYLSGSVSVGSAATTAEPTCSVRAPHARLGHLTGTCGRLRSRACRRSQARLRPRCALALGEGDLSFHLALMLAGSDHGLVGALLTVADVEARGVGHAVGVVAQEQV